VSGSSNFLQFNPTQANQETDAQYLVDPLRTGGYSLDAIVPGVLLNKATFQASTWITAMAQMMATKGFTVSDANLSTLTSVLASIITTVDLAPYALLAGPVFSGSPTVPAPSGGAGDNSLHIANTAWVQSFFATLAYVNATFASISYVNGTFAPVSYVNSTFAPLASPNLSGTPRTPTPGAGDATSIIPNTAWVATYFATLASPVFSGSPTVPTRGLADNTLGIANTAWVQNNFTGSSAGWQKFVSGIIIQWGGSGIIPPITTGRINYPITFPNGTGAPVACYTNGAIADPTRGNPINVHLPDQSGFYIYNGGTSDSQYFWIAIGF
jgi:hypothetical protein